jgi:hypothetical protein
MGLGHVAADDKEAVALVKGIMAYESNAYGYARRFFEKISEPLSSGLLAQIDKQIKDKIEQAACDNLRVVISCVGVDVPDEFDVYTWQSALDGAIVDSSDINRVVRAIDVYMSEYGTTDFAASAMPVIDELKSILENENKPTRRRSFGNDEVRSIKKQDVNLGWRNKRPRKPLVFDDL